MNLIRTLQFLIGCLQEVASDTPFHFPGFVSFTNPDTAVRENVGTVVVRVAKGGGSLVF